VREVRALVGRYGIRNFTDSTCGVVHRMVLEDIAIPGELAIGNDSHSCAWGALNCVATGMGDRGMVFAIATEEQWFRVPETIRVRLTGQLAPYASSKDIVLQLAGAHGSDFALYRSLEFDGAGLDMLWIEARMGLATHAVELGAKFGLFPFDAVAAAFLAAQRNGPERLAAARPCASIRRIVDEGEEVELDLDSGLIRNPQRGISLAFAPIAPTIARILKSGGILGALRLRHVRTSH
jgi:3-isopropylmalate/(R)-2-methylmalate dehydratase large subunit